jgi:tetratricopeptide (TPR) repeat protein
VYEKLSEISDHVIHSGGANPVEKRRAFDAMEEAVRRHPELDKARRRLLDLMMEFRNWDRALEHAKYIQDELKAQGKSDADIDLKAAQCEMATNQEPKAKEHLAGIIGFNEATMLFDGKPASGPDKLDAYISLASILRKRVVDRKAADLVLEQMVAVNNTSAAYVQRGHFHHFAGNAEKSAADYEKAFELDPENADAILVMAQVLARQNKLEESLKLVADGVQKHPKNESLWRAQAHLQLQSGKNDEAIESLNKGIEVAKEDLVLLVDKAEFLVAMNQPDRAKPVLAELKKLKINDAVLQDIEARQFIAQKDWKQALKLLSRVEPLLAKDPERGPAATLRLAQCYEVLNESERALEAYKRVLDRDPENVTALIGAGKALEKQGKNSEATRLIAKADEILSKKGFQSTQLRGVILYQMINEQLRKPKEERDWAPVDAVAEELVKDESYTPAQKEMLQTDVLLYKGEYAEASKRLLALLKKEPKEIAIYLRLYELTQRQASETSDEQQRASLLKRAGNILATAEKEVGDTAQVRLTRINYVLRQPDKQQHKEQLATIEKGIEKFTENEQLALWNELGTAHYRLRNYEDVQRCWAKVAEKRPDDAKIAQLRFEVAREFGDEPGMESLLNDIKEKIGAESGVYHYSLASQIVSQVRSGKKDKAALTQARLAADEARRDRAEWHELSRIEGEIEELDGNLDAAIAHYRTALEQGPFHPGITERLVKLLYVRGKYDEAAQILSTTGSGLKGEMLDKIRVVTKVKSGDSEEAITQAEAVVEKNPDDVNNQIWLAALYNHASRPADAEKVYRKVIELDPKTPRHWLLLVFHLANDKKLSDGEVVLRDAREQLPAEDVPLTMAQGYEMLGAAREAERFYLEALEAKPDDIGVLRYAAQFFTRTNRTQMAMDYLDKILSKKVAADSKDIDSVRWARRTKALILTAKLDYKSFSEGLKLVDANADEKGNLGPEDLLLKVNLLSARQDRPSRNQAIALLAKLKEKRQLGANEQFNLARLYERAGNWADARREMIEVLNRSGNAENVNHIAAYATMLVKHDEIQDAQLWYNKLIQLAPKSPAAIELRARLMVKAGKAEQAVALLEQLVPENLPADQIGNLAAIANLFIDMQQYEPAERLLRRQYALQPRTALTLATFLGEHGNLDEAFDLMENARRSSSLIEIVRAGTQTLRMRQLEAGKKHYDRVQGWITAGLEEDPNSEALQLSLAELMDVQGKYAEVADRYRQYIARADIDEQRRAVAKNNLAFVLIVAPQKPGDADEALRLINEAITVFGATSDMLDTRGMAYYAKGDYRRAITDLKAAIEDGASAVKYFHLALAQRKNEETGEAIESLKRAKQLKLDENQLAKAERPWLHQLVKDLPAQ